VVPFREQVLHSVLLKGLGLRTRLANAENSSSKQVKAPHKLIIEKRNLKAIVPQKIPIVPQY